MPSRIDSWLGTSTPLAAYDDHDPAIDAAIIVADKPTSIVITRYSGATPATLAAQSVRLEWQGGDRQVQGPGGVTYSIDALVLAGAGGDLQSGDTFKAAGRQYRIVALIAGLTDEVQAYATVVS